MRDQEHKFLEAVAACERASGTRHRATSRRGFAVIEGEAAELLRVLPPDSVDAVVTDPPYSSGGAFRGDRMQSTHDKYVGPLGRRRPDFDGDNRDQRSFVVWASMWMAQALRATKPGGLLCVFSDWRQLPATTDAIQAAGWVWQGTVPWDKTEASRPRHGGFRTQSEYILWASKGPLDPQRSAQVGYLPGAYRIRVDSEEKLHQTAKPLVLMQNIVLVCPPGGTVLDPFLGSGTTMVAALAEGCTALGFELVPHYAELSRRRCLEQELPASLRAERPLGAPPRGSADSRARKNKRRREAEQQTDEPRDASPFAEWQRIEGHQEEHNDGQEHDGDVVYIDDDGEGGVYYDGEDPGTPDEEDLR